MVSTRGVKLKFFDGERVLCYEPDPTKAKVLYDSKVLEVILNKDQRGRKTVEYLIHFQGWNSSWDRCVSEDFVLKDTPENRQLQRDLAQKAQLQLGAYLYRRERKKRKERKLSDRIAVSSEDGSCGSPALMDTDDTHAGITTSSDSGSSGDEDVVPLELTATLRHALEHDHYLINTKNKLLKLPAEPHVVTILDRYWRHFVSRELAKVSDKQSARNRNATNANSSLPKHKPQHVQNNLNTCKELVDGLRVYFDYTLCDLLLYNKERDQTPMSQATFPTMICAVKLENKCMSSVAGRPDRWHFNPDHIKTETDEMEYSHLPPFDADGYRDDNRRSGSGRRWLRSHRSTDSECNGNLPEPPVVPVKHEGVNVPASGQHDTPLILSKLLSWQMLPEHVYNQDPPPPCLMYGATHLTRLLVKLPDLLYASNISDDKLKLLLKHLDLFVEFLSEHKEWYGDKHYVDVSLAVDSA